MVTMKMFKIFLLSYLVLIAFVLIGTGDANSERSHRIKRYLRFDNISHFFYRLNFKANMVPWNQIYAYALGFRMNWDEPPDSFHPYRHLHRRSVYDNLETLLDRNGLNGYHCIRRAVCETQMLLKPTGVYFNILKMVFRKQSSATEKWHNVTEEGCQQSISNCPFSLLEVSPYTDL
ncbi:uncharacterized protein LOC133527271 [Cydia pomonella]|uniref:uncharacterized protein LOC133527271 n=1 Tax=Cydia pomonella TaxID=82600 RepID=UPI002ADD8A84|nr:uncharacterized protein LOC133527271 [Cydia pomonella]